MLPSTGLDYQTIRMFAMDEDAPREVNPKDWTEVVIPIDCREEGRPWRYYINTKLKQIRWNSPFENPNESSSEEEKDILVFPQQDKHNIDSDVKNVPGWIETFDSRHGKIFKYKSNVNWILKEPPHWPKFKRSNTMASNESTDLEISSSNLSRSSEDSPSNGSSSPGKPKLTYTKSSLGLTKQYKEARKIRSQTELKPNSQSRSLPKNFDISASSNSSNHTTGDTAPKKKIPPVPNKPLPPIPIRMNRIDISPSSLSASLPEITVTDDNKQTSRPQLSTSTRTVSSASFIKPPASAEAPAPSTDKPFIRDRFNSLRMIRGATVSMSDIKGSIMPSSATKAAKIEARNEQIQSWDEIAHREAEEWFKDDSNEAKWEQNIVGIPDDCPLIDMECVKLGFSVEFGSITQEHFETLDMYIQETDKDVTHYQQSFSSTEHTNYSGEDESLGPYVISIEGKKAVEQKILRAIVRSRKGDKKVAIIGQYDQVLPFSSKDKIKALKQAYPEIAPIKFVSVKGPQDDVIQHLISYEQKCISKKYKFGILYVKEGQVDENEFFNNKETTPAFENFLSCIGTRVKLQGFTGYAGGLDVKKGSTGAESIYTTHKGYEIMFHVSTMLPYFPKDTQQVERKRHLGNDVVLVIFKEGGQPFSPQCIASQFNHVFIVVEPESDGKSFRFAIASKFGVRPFHPPLPNPPVFAQGSKLRDYLLTKLINAEKGAMYAPDFKQRLSKTRTIWLKDTLSMFDAKKKTHQERLRKSVQGMISAIGNKKKELDISGPKSPVLRANTKDEAKRSPEDTTQVKAEEYDPYDSEDETPSTSPNPSSVLTQAADIAIEDD